jgi:hypothetical protein
MFAKGAPTESFVIFFGATRVSPHSISFSHALFDGLSFSLGMTSNQIDFSHPHGDLAPKPDWKSFHNIECAGVSL